MMADYHYHRDYCYQDELFQHLLTKIQADDDNPDVMLLCRNEEIVQTRKSLLSLYSPVFRTMMGSIPGGTRSDMEMVMMPDYSRPVVESMIRILKMDWSDRDTWGLEVKEIMQELNITVGRFFEKEVERKVVDTGVKEEVSSEMSEESLPAFNEPTPAPTPVSLPGTNSENEKRVQEAKCPVSNCSRLFTGAKIKDSLKTHIGVIHFNKELLDLMDREYFVNSNNCNDCGRTFPKITQKKKHLVFNHTKYVDEVMKLVNKAIENSNDDKDNSIYRSVNNSSSANHLTNLKKNSMSFPLEENNEFSMKLFKCSFECNQRWSSNTNKMKRYMKMHLITHFAKRYKPFQREYFKNKLCLKCPKLQPIPNNNFEMRHLLERHGVLRDEIGKCLEEILNPRHEQPQLINPVIVATNSNSLKDKMSKISILSEAKNQFKCSFDCNKKWEMDRKIKMHFLKSYIKRHLLTHFEKRYEPFQNEYFKNKLCLKCPPSKPIHNNNFELQHLLERHGVLRDEIEKCLEEILNQRHEQPQFSNPTIVATNINALKDTMNMSNIDILSEQGETTHNHNDEESEDRDNTDNDDHDRDNTDHDVDALLHSDNEETEDEYLSKSLNKGHSVGDKDQEDTADIQKMLLEDNSSDSDSDSDDSLLKRIDEDFEDENFDIGNTETENRQEEFNEDLDVGEDMAEDDENDADDESDGGELEDQETKECESMNTEDDHHDSDEDDGGELEDQESSTRYSESMNTTDDHHDDDDHYDGDDDDHQDGEELEAMEPGVGSEAMDTGDNSEDDMQQQLLEDQDFSSSDDEDDISDEES